MSLFQKHSQKNETVAKAAMEKVARATIAKYIIAQKELCNVMIQGDKRHTKKEPCMLCKADRILGIMAKLESKVGQVTKAYKVMFNGDMDTKSMTDEAVNDLYPEMYGANLKPRKRDNDVEDRLTGHVASEKGFQTLDINNMPDDMPEDVKVLMRTIKDTLKNMPNSAVDVQVVEMKGKRSLFGVDPNDYDSFEKFEQAVIKARKAKVAADIFDATKNGEETIKENIINNVEAFVENVEKESKKAKRMPKSASKAEGENKDLLN